ncbi:hypothetical protein RE6C_01402 [Rhodopirellula europaea 6C]|uniref:Uncharacterized protein n=1 Tax=Rhodopirellula europaea 6C TaxID=1263867 RepID=M2B7Z7_9BACT|nr:hypothetical protein RE6C_01402 [Rhodopirellula europaea 6C]
MFLKEVGKEKRSISMHRFTTQPMCQQPSQNNSPFFAADAD